MDHADGDGDGDPCSDPLTPPEDCRSLGAGGHEVGDIGVRASDIRALAAVSSSEPDSVWLSAAVCRVATVQ